MIMSSEKVLPLYQQVLNDLRSKIVSGELRPADSIPTQIELAKMYGTSEVTARRALTELANEGFIIRMRKKGSFVKDWTLKKEIEKETSEMKNPILGDSATHSLILLSQWNDDPTAAIIKEEIAPSLIIRESTKELS